MAPYSERRQTIRITVHGNLHVESTSPGQSLRLIDVGTGGFAARSPAPVPVDLVANYRFRTTDRKWSAIFRARALHVKLLPADGLSPPEYQTGFMFLNIDTPAVLRELMTMMDQAMNSVSFS